MGSHFLRQDNYKVQTRNSSAHCHEVQDHSQRWRVKKYKAFTKKGEIPL